MGQKNHPSQKSWMNGQIASEPTPSSVEMEQILNPSVNTSPSHPEKNSSKKSKKKKAEEDLTTNAHLLALNYEGRTSDEIDTLKQQLILPIDSISYLSLYRYATRFDIFLIIASNIGAICAGAALPLMTLIMGNLTNIFTKFLTTGQGGSEFQHSINHNTLYFVYLAIGICVLHAFQTFVAVDRGEVLTARIREHYIQAILRQNIAYFDKVGPGEITNRITSDINLIQEGISEKVNLIFSGFATFFAGIIIGLIRSWKLALILFSTVVAIIFSMGVSSVFMMKHTIAALEAFAKASSVAEDILSSIRTTTAFGLQNRLSRNFNRHVEDSFRSGVKAGRAIMVMIGCLWLIVYWSYGLAFWKGVAYVVSGDTTAGDIITVIMAIIIGSISIGGVTPALQSVGKSVGAAKKIFETIDRVPVIDSASDEGHKLDTVSGRIELSHVRFAYPSRPNVTVLKDFSLTIEPGQTVALVGASGSGKSTIIGIVERFYSYLGGSVTLDGVELSSFNVKWLRQQMALVSQEPTLFSVSIFDNISYGLIGTPHEHSSNEEKMGLVVDACKQANAWEFIQNLPMGLDTNVGQQGFLLSGGQKQRIAIARAIVSQPKILLLDEATSALDIKSEGVVQEALDRVAANRTTIVIAHRLSTIKDADKIVVMSNGSILEVGTHHELLEKKGAYYMLVKTQDIKHKDEHASDDASALGFSSIEDKTEPFEDEAANMVIDLSRRRTEASEHSISDRVLADMAEKGQLSGENVTRSTFKLIRYLNKFTVGYNKLLIFGGICGILSGVGYPIMCFLYGKVLDNLMVPPSMYDHMHHSVNVLSGYFVLLGGLEFFIFCGLMGILTYHNQVLVKEIRIKVFQHYLRMDVAFFDDEKNSTGALAATLSKDGQSVEGFGGVTLGQILNSCSILIGGIAMAISINWRLGLVCTSVVPVLVFCGFLRVYVLTKLEENAKSTYADSGQYACESVSAVRTVASLTKEDLVCSTYAAAIDNQVKQSRIPLARSAILYGISEGIQPAIVALGFFYGATLIRRGQSNSYQFFTALTAVIFGAQSAGQVFSFAPSMGKARQASQNISRVFDVEPTIDPSSTEGGVMDEVVGDIEFRDVYFRYPTRPHVPVLRGLNITVKRGQYVALVGASGCGKSTTIGLIERFYNVLSGTVLLDGVDISTLNVGEYRKHIGLVQQEPVLYNGTIRENILLGVDEAHADSVTDEELYVAARKANIHDFVMSLPEGYDTQTGAKGTLLSGGQKQRVAIARALIRNPKVLLLDEATSALDSESEKVVQAALDEAAKGRTTIAIAHRLSTIQNADVIYLIDNGRVAEAGTHDELFELKGRYYQLVKMQALEEAA